MADFRNPRRTDDDGDGHPGPSEGQVMDYIVTHGEGLLKQPVDVEIYRPILGANEPTVAGMSFNETTRIGTEHPLTTSDQMPSWEASWGI
ncbi:hypothetical protein IMZ48_44950 [Candidatus Bathyarchaeota archaeon]|nr:hypothetical protein [Candidatus Bathyarchaeota archaeon]